MSRKACKNGRALAWDFGPETEGRGWRSPGTLAGPRASKKAAPRQVTGRQQGTESRAPGTQGFRSVGPQPDCLLKPLHAPGAPKSPCLGAWEGGGQSHGKERERGRRGARRRSASRASYALLCAHLQALNLVANLQDVCVTQFSYPSNDRRGRFSDSFSQSQNSVVRKCGDRSSCNGGVRKPTCTPGALAPGVRLRAAPWAPASAKPRLFTVLPGSCHAPQL